MNTNAMQFSIVFFRSFSGTLSLFLRMFPYSVILSRNVGIIASTLRFIALVEVSESKLTAKMLNTSSADNSELCKN